MFAMASQTKSKGALIVTFSDALKPSLSMNMGNGSIGGYGPAIWRYDANCELSRCLRYSFSNSMCRGSGSDVIRVLPTSALAHGSTLWRQWRRSAIDAVVVSQPPERPLLMSVLAKGCYCRTAGNDGVSKRRSGGAEVRSLREGQCCSNIYKVTSVRDLIGPHNASTCLPTYLYDSCGS